MLRKTFAPIRLSKTPTNDTRHNRVLKFTRGLVGSERGSGDFPALLFRSRPFRGSRKTLVARTVFGLAPVDQEMRIYMVPAFDRSNPAAHQQILSRFGEKQFILPWREKL